MIYWIYILIASLFEACWIYSLKFLNLKDVMGIRPNTLLIDTSGWRVIFPLLGYIVFGLSNIYFFSLAMKGIPASTAFAVWMVFALTFSKLIDVFVFNEPYNLPQLFFAGIALVGVIGLKYYSKN